MPNDQTPRPAPDLATISSYDFFEPVTLRYSDQDAMGHVNNVAYAAFFEAGRLGLFMGLMKTLGDARLNFVLANLSIDYLREMHFPGQLQVGGRLLRVGTKSIHTGYGVFLDSVCHATSSSVNVYFDPETRRSKTIPDSLRAALIGEIT